ncbi:hypothetical protein SAMN05216327_10250 [Dyadobacter sp. SG02]|uniref:hypothetical protein n=1 Tax=Dyadobacter sp. SG02 TaxID=1855291 RepID=UPI0008B19A62|nr:hypothetical protein [Dyadobacter sp. SG02]SEI49916.1 hypothetical protein SAMN05216327_10250 [Dyadobacter sp. SG02]
MTRNSYIFGIGGTGARIVRALTMMLAAGTKVKDTGKIVPIIIDVDAKNADTARTLQALGKYKYIRERGYGPSEEIRDGFFNANLNTLSSIKTAQNSSEKLDDSFQLQFENLEKSFIQYLDPNDELVGDINMDLLEALYDNTPPDHADFHESELHLRLDQGFKGNPNIGSVVFNNLANTDEFKFVLKSIGEHDRIFIISSIFGGTGSSGFPQLVRLLQHEEKLRPNIFGALTVMPYFNVTDNSASAINSDRFNSKTEAALAYYHKYLKGRINCFYQLWDQPLRQYENKEGGMEQRNSAHLLELIGATAVIDFINKPDGAFKPKGQTEYLDFGIKKEDQVIDIRHFYDATARNVMYPLTLLTYAMKMHLDVIPKHRNEAFYKELDLESKWTNDLFYQTLSDFFKNHYCEWLEEMSTNERSFQPFNLKQDLNGLVREKAVPVSRIMGMITDGGISDSFLRKELGKAEDELKKTYPEPEERFFRLLHTISAKCFSKLDSLPTMI